MVGGWSLIGKFDGEFGQSMMWIALLSRLGIILDRQASWMVAAVRAPLVLRKRRERVISATDPEQTTTGRIYFDKDNWGSANGCHLSSGSRLPVPPIEPQLQRSICERRVPTPGHGVGGDGTGTRGPHQVRSGGRYMATLPAVARLRRGPLAKSKTGHLTWPGASGPSPQPVSRTAQAFRVGRHQARARDATAMETARLFCRALACHSSR